MIYLYVFLLIILLLVIGVSFYISKSIFKPNVWDYDETYKHELEQGLIDEQFLSKYSIEDVSIINDGLKLHAKLINNHSEKSIIIMHGHTFSLFGSYKYIKIFLNLGFNILMPDQRYHGLSEGKSTTLGYKEANDLEAWTKYIQEIIVETKIIGYHGESMGAATVLLNGHNQNINFIISDCGFSDLGQQTKELLWRKFKIPSFMVYPTHILSSILYGAPLLKIRPIDNIRNITVPILFIHGDSDTYISLNHVESLNNVAKDSKIYLAKGANHAKSIQTNFDMYNKEILTFLKERDII